MRRRWSEEEDDFLRFAFEKRMKLKEIEKALDGRTQIAIRSRYTALGLRRNFPPREIDGLVRCSHCEKYKPKEEFILLGNGRYYCYCNECKSNLTKEKYLKKKKEELINKSLESVKSKVEANSGLLERTCSRCKKVKNVEDFPWSIKGERLSSVCKICRNELNKEYQNKRLRTKGF